MTVPRDLSAVIELAEQQVAAQPRYFSTGRAGETTDLAVFVLRDGDGSQALKTLDLTEYAERPFAMEGRSVTYDAASFIAVVNRNSDPRATTLWADKRTASVLAVLDDHEQIGDHVEAKGFTKPVAGRRQHRATLRLTPTDEWNLWTGRNGKLMGQTEFAEFLEDGALNIVDPDPATFLEIALSLRAHTSVEFKSSTVLESGEVGFRYEETVSAKAGHAGNLEIPRTFQLSVAPYEGGDSFDLHARLLYRVSQEKLQLGYRLLRPNEVLTAAFTQITDEVARGVGLSVYAGTTS